METENNEKLLPGMIPGDELVYKGHVILVKRPYLGKPFDVMLSKDAVVMLYIDENDDVYLTKQFRPAINQEELCLPAETLDKPGLSPLEVMLEGLEEECGRKITAEQTEYVGKVASSPGHDSEWVHMLIGRGESEYVGQRLEDTEKIEVVKKPFDEVYNLALKGEITGPKTMALIFYEKLRRLDALTKLEDKK